MTGISSTVNESSTRRMSRTHVALWVAQALLAAMFVFAGMTKLVVPGLARIRTGLTPLAAAGLVVIMTGAVITTLAIGGAAEALVRKLAQAEALQDRTAQRKEGQQ